MRVIAWRAWPVRRSPGRGVLAGILVAGSCYGVADWTGDPWMTGLAIVVLLVAVVPFFAPTGYRLTPEGVEIRRPWKTRRRPWEDFRTVRSGPGLVVLSPLVRGSWLDAIRGETLLLDGSGEEEVLEYVEEMVGETPGPGTR